MSPRARRLWVIRHRERAWQSPAKPVGRFPPALHRHLHCTKRSAVQVTQCGRCLADARHDINRVYVTASRRQAAWRSPAGPGRFGIRHRERAWQSPAKQGGRFLTSFGMTFTGIRHREPPSGGAAVSRRAGTIWYTSPRAAAGGVAVSRRAGTKTPTCTGKCPFGQGDTNKPFHRSI